MGLDITFYRAERKDYEEKIAQMKAIKEELKVASPSQISTLKVELNEIDPYEEVAYFRKFNLLVKYFNYKENCSDKEITKPEVESLVRDCKQVLELHKECPDKDISATLQNKLPTMPGFFFGNTDYNDYYFQQVQEVLDTFSEILEETNWETQMLFMYCWW